MKQKVLIIISLILISLLSFVDSYAYETANCFVFPIDNYTNDSCLDWGAIITGKDGKLKQHVGDDYCVPIKTDVNAIGKGRVKYIWRDSNGSMGWYGLIIMEHELPNGQNICSLYGHAEATEVAVGDEIDKIGKKIGEIIEYPPSSNHIHFGIYNGSFGATEGTYPSWACGYLPLNVWPGQYLNPVAFIESHQCPQNQSLARIKGTSLVYWLQNGRAYYVLNIDILNGMSGLPGWNHICDYPPYALEIISIGPVQPKITFIKGPDFIAASSDDLLIKLPDDPKVYLIENGELRWITTETTFKALGYNSDDIIIVTQAILDLIPKGDPITINIDVALIIDSSGSMGWNDPMNLRKEAAEIFVGVAQNEDQIAIIDFDSYMKTLWHLQPLTENRDGIIAAINSIDSSGGTNIGRGLLGGYYELLSSSEPNSRAAVLLTDGDGSYYGEAELFKTEGWPIHTIGLGSSVNSPLLNNIANETGGIYFPLNDANQLKNVYFEIATHITGGTSIFGKTLYMLTGDFYELLVNVPLYQQMVTFLISWPGSDVSTTLVTPSGRQITPDTIDTDVYHAKGLTYELYRINNPEPGEWAVGLTGVVLSPGGEEVSVSASSVGLAAPVDTTPPIISISNPVNGKTYFDQLPTNFNFMIDDPESAIVSQSALLNGVPINNNDNILLTQLGENVLTITATNEANLTNELSITFYVNHFSWLPPIRYQKGSATENLTSVIQANSTLPLKFAIFDADSSFVEDPTVKVMVEGTTAQFTHGEGDTNIRINQEEGEEPLYIVNIHTNFNKCDYGLEEGNEYNLTIYFNDILAARAKLRIE